MVVAANSRGRYPRLPAEQRVNSEFMLGPRAAVARIPHQVQNGCRRSNAHLAGQDPPRPWPTPMAPMDGSNGTEASDCVAVPPVRVCDRPSRRATAVDRVLGSAARCGAVRRRAIMRRSSRRAIARRPKNQSNSEAVERTCTLVVRAGSGAREPGAQSLATVARVRGRGGCSVRARARTHKERQETICEHRDHSYLPPSVCTGFSGAGR